MNKRKRERERLRNRLRYRDKALVPRGEVGGELGETGDGDYGARLL